MDGMRKRIEGFQPGRIYGSSQASGDEPETHSSRQAQTEGSSFAN